MSIHQRKGFTLIEILIVVAIIAILASVVLVGLGPTQQAGRDARRISDLTEIQNGLELYYNKCGTYPGIACAAGVAGAGWGPASTAGTFAATLVGAGVGLTNIPQDPSNAKSYNYWYGAGNSTYVLGAGLENANNSVFTNYNAPTPGTEGVTGLTGEPDTCASPNYCVTL